MFMCLALAQGGCHLIYHVFTLSCNLIVSIKTYIGPGSDECAHTSQPLSALFGCVVKAKSCFL